MRRKEPTATGGLGLAIRRKEGAAPINHKAVLRLMNRVRHPFSGPADESCTTKMSQLETYHHYENVLNRDFSATRPNQKWVTDVTYVAHPAGLGLPVHDQRSVRRLYRCPCHEPLQLRGAGHPNPAAGPEKEKVTDGLILHSDQGHQYTSHAYHVLTQQVHFCSLYAKLNLSP